MEGFVSVFVRRPVTTFVVVIVMIVLGILSLTKLEMALMPDVEFPTVMIVVPSYGSTAREMEETIIDPLERVLMGVSGLERIESRIRSNVTMIVMNFKWGTDMDGAMMEISEKLDSAGMFLPRGVNPMIFRFSPDMMPIVVLSISGEDWESIRQVALDLKSTIERLPGVSLVTEMGMRREEIQVRVDYRKLISHGVGMSMVPNAIQSANTILSGGIHVEGEKYFPVNVTTKFKDLKDLGKVLLPKGAGFGTIFGSMMRGMNIGSLMGPKPTLKLEDVAEIGIGLMEGGSVARLNGKPSAFLVVQKRSGVNLIDACDQVKGALSKIDIPSDVDVEIVMDQSEYMLQSMNTLTRNLIIGAIVVVFVLMLFLRDLSVVFLVSISIPASLLVGLTLMYFSKMTINVMSLGGLALAVGMLIDNAIVVTESIYRSRERLDGFKASIVGASEVAGAITASTLTTISVFLPIAFMKGFAERMFTDLALAVTYTLLASLLVSLTFIPSMSRFAMRSPKVRFESFRRHYSEILRKVLKHKGLFASIVLILFLLSLYVIYDLGFSLMPSAVVERFRVRFFLPPGTSVSISKKVMAEIEGYFMKNSERFKIDYIYSSCGMDEEGMGSFFTMDSGYENGFVALKLRREENLMPFDEMKSVIEQELFTKLKEEYPGIRLDFLTPYTFESEIFGKPVEVEIRGDEDSYLKEISDEILERLKSLKFVKNVSSNVARLIETVRVVPDQEKLLSRKLSSLQIAAEIRALNMRQSAGTMLYKGKVLDISVYPVNAPKNLEDVIIPNTFGVKVKLTDVAKLEKIEEPLEYIHRDGRKIALISMDISGISQSEALKKVKEILLDLKLPRGYSIRITGQAETTEKEIKQIASAMIFGIVLMYVIMAGTFESFVHPFIIMFTVPLGLIGVALSFWIIQKPINVVAMIGIVMLFGIVVNNGIVMIDQINRLRKRGLSKIEAVVEGASVRLRPILMTSLTTITALLPELFLKGEGKEYHAPMAIAVVGGLSVATLLTLFFIPVLYVMFSRKD